MLDTAGATAHGNVRDDRLAAGTSKAPDPRRADDMPPACVHIVDDDPAIRSALTRLLEVSGYEVRAFDTARSFLAQQGPTAQGCLILDVAMPEIDGLTLQELLAESGSQLPIIFLTGQSDVPMCARAMKLGALDFLTKPVDEALLLPAVDRALALDRRIRQDLQRRSLTAERLDSLTPREREVLLLVATGRLNKQIAGDLGTAEKTVKVHRARAMEKMQVRSVAELVRDLERAGRSPG